jgi:hypothetical protein
MGYPLSLRAITRPVYTHFDVHASLLGGAFAPYVTTAVEGVSYILIVGCLSEFSRDRMSIVAAESSIFPGLYILTWIFVQEYRVGLRLQKIWLSTIG